MVMVAGMGLFISSGVPQSAITGRISPANAAREVMIIGTDTTRAAIASGAFSTMVRPGNYKLIVDAIEPYKDVLLDNLDVKENQVLDVGEIILEQ